MPSGSVADWLTELGLAEYIELFERERLEVSVLPDLNESDLEKLGLPLGHRKRLLKAISALSSAALNVQPVSASPLQAERRQLTILFCDLVGSTALSKQIDPEQLREVMRDYQITCTGVISRYDGHVAQYLGDGLMVYFGWPRAHEDDAERAVRAGLEIVDAVNGMQGPEKMQVRIGIATGPVVVGETGAGDASVPKMAVGETPNIAARVQAMAQPDEVVIASSTLRLIGSTFVMEDLGECTLKGVLEPVHLSRVRAVARAEGRFSTTREVHLTPFIGREDEIALLESRWTRACQGQGQVVLIGGEPGIGKSRIIQEVRLAISAHSHAERMFQCSPYHTSSAFHPLIVQLEQLAAVDREDSPDCRLDKLERVIEQLGSSSELARPLFASLLSLPVDRYPSLHFSPQRRKEELLRIVVEQLKAVSVRRPVLLLFEDTHWIDPSSLEMLDLLVQQVRDSCILMVITFRPEFNPPWTGQSHVTTLSLNRMGRNQSATLIDHLTRSASLPASMLNEIVSKADGVPLFVEELTKAVLESGMLKRSGDRYELNAVPAAITIPTTLQDSLIARLDRLGPVREVAQVGACIGREFSHELIASILPMDASTVRHAMDQLVVSELVFRRGAPPDAVYTFKHALVQDAAYAMLLKSRRQQLHAAIARALERNAGEAGDVSPEVLAHHYSRAGLPDAAAPRWLEAGRRSLSRMALPEAVSQLMSAMDQIGQLSQAEPRDRLELETRVTLGTAYFALLGWVAVEVIQALRPAREIAQRLGDREKLVSILYYLWFHHGMRSDYEQALAAAGEIDAVAEASGDAGAKATALMTRACCHAWMGQFAAARQLGDELEAVYDFDRHRHLADSYNHDIRCLTLVWAGSWLWALGWPERSRRACLEQLAHARKVGHAFNLLWGLSGGTMGLLLLRETAVIHEWLQELRDVGREQAMPIAELLHQWWDGYAAIVEGQYERGYAQLEPGARFWRTLGGVHLVPYANLMLARALSHRGRVKEALALVEDAEAVIEQTNHRMHEAEVYRVKGEILVIGGSDLDLAEIAFRKALVVAKAQDAKGWELRAASSLARLWQQQGRADEAHALLSETYKWFTEGFDTPDIKEAAVLLDELSSV
jgi:class 3 adenylate cyclase/predicted ATPase